jgi:hypothetical protein
MTSLTLACLAPGGFISASTQLYTRAARIERAARPLSMYVIVCDSLVQRERRDRNDIESSQY